MIRILALVLSLAVFTGARAQRSVEARFQNKDTIRFAGTLTLPDGQGPFTAVVFVSGTGQQDRDGTMAGHKMFKYLADSLVRIGIASLRVDDRGVGGTNGNYAEATTCDFAQDALAAVRFLKTQPHIGKVGLIGHSEGGAAVIMAAAESREVAFVVTLAGLASRAIESLKEQNRNLIQLAPISNYDKKRHETITLRMLDTAYCYAGDSLLESRLRATHAAWKQADDSAFLADNPGKYDHLRFFLESYIHTAKGRWYQYQIRWEPDSFLRQIQVPFLALNGDKDIMVPAALNLSNIKRVLTAAGNKDVTTVALPGLNHLLLRCEKCTNEELPKLKGDFDETAWLAIKNWLIRHQYGIGHLTGGSRIE